MPSVEKIPRIDPSVRHVRVSKLRDLNADALREMKDTLVIQDVVQDDQPLAVLLTYDRFLAMQEELDAVTRTVALLSNKTELDALQAGFADITAGRIRSLEEIDAAEQKKGKR